jgi:hypothetical protein
LIRRIARQLRSRLRARRAPPIAPLSHTLSLDDPGDPFAACAMLRAEGSVVHLPWAAAWIVLDDATSRQLLSQPERFSSAAWNAFDAVLLGADPPRHGAVRRVVARSFGVAAIARFEELARQECDRLIDARFDAVDLARSVSRAMAVALTGFAPESVQRITAAERDPDEANRLERLFTVLDEEAPSAQVYGRLLADGADVLTPAEARSVVRLLWLASTVTTERAIAHAVLRLATDRALQARLRAEPALVPVYVDEIIRLFPPEMIIRRIAVEAVTIDGVAIPAGAELLVCPGAAGRDPAAHGTPDELDLTRQSRGLSFGHGPHMCIGGPLARRVVVATVERLLAAGPGFALDADEADLPYTRTMAVLAPNHVPIRMEMAPT